MKHATISVKYLKDRVRCAKTNAEHLLKMQCIIFDFLHIAMLID